MAEPERSPPPVGVEAGLSAVCLVVGLGDPDRREPTGGATGCMVKPYTMMKPWIDKYQPPKEEMAGILELGFDNVLPGHGEAVIGGAREKFRPAIEAYVGAAGAAR